VVSNADVLDCGEFGRIEFFDGREVLGEGLVGLARVEKKGSDDMMVFEDLSQSIAHLLI
jgi:hypothetical protein